MKKTSLDLEQIFGEAIYRYTRAQALVDGVLVDITETARQAGFRVPVAMTAAAWGKAVAWSEADSERQTLQDEKGRLWDVVWMGYMAARRAKCSCRVPFQLYAVPRGGSATDLKLMTLHMVIGPGDEGEPVKYHRQSRWLEIVSASKAPIKP